MHTALQSLLHQSAATATAGHTAESWRIMHRYATEFWLEEPTEPLGEFYTLRAGAADCLGMADEAVQSLHAMQRWAEEHDPPVALIARAHLAYQSLNDDAQIYRLEPPENLLNSLLDDLRAYADGRCEAEDAEDNVIGGNGGNGRNGNDTDDNGTDGKHSSNTRLAGTLVLAATTAYTVASNMEHREFASAFAELVRAFGTKAPSEADRQLWFAQEHWTNGRRSHARAIAEQIPTQFPNNIIARFESYDMQAHFDLIETLEDDHHRRSIASHWVACADIAMTLGAPLVALRRTGLACRALLGQGQAQDSYHLAQRMREAMDGAPTCPAMLELAAVQAEAAFEMGDDEQALQLGAPTAQWSEMFNDLEQAAQCYSIAALASMNLGNEATQLQVRRAEVLAKMDNPMAAAQSFLTIAVATDDLDYLRRAWELIDPSHPDHLWVVAEAHLSAASIHLNVGDLVSADESLRCAEELVFSLPDADDLISEFHGLQSRRFHR